MEWETKESARGLRKLASETQASKYCFQPPQGTLRSSLSRRRVFGALYLRNIWQVLKSRMFGQLETNLLEAAEQI